MLEMYFFNFPFRQLQIRKITSSVKSMTVIVNRAILPIKLNSPKLNIKPFKALVYRTKYLIFCEFNITFQESGE